MADDPGNITLRDIAQRLDAVATDLAGLRGSVTTALGDGARVMGELRDEIRSLRKDREDDRQRLLRAEGDIRDLQQYRDTQSRSRRDLWRSGLQLLIMVSGWAAAFLHPWSRGAGG